MRLEEAEAACVAEMFALYLMEGQSLAGVVKHVMRLGIPNPSGMSRWSLMTVRGILANPTYTGTVYAGRERAVPKRKRLSPLYPMGRRNSSQETSCEEWIEVGQVPALVTKEQFEMVQAKLARNYSFARRNNTSHQYLLRAMLSCGLCGLSCNGRSSKAHAYYFCRGKLEPLQSSRDETCHSRSIPADQLDQLVWQDVCDVLSKPEIIGQALQRAQSGEWLPQALQARRAQVRKARTSLSGQLERLTEAYMAGVLPLAEYKRHRQDLDQRLEALDNQARQIEANVHQQMELASLTSSITAFCQRVNRGLLEASFERKRQLVEMLIDRVVVTMEEVEIRYVVPTSPQSEQIRFCHLLTDYSAAK